MKKLPFWISPLVGFGLFLLLCAIKGEWQSRQYDSPPKLHPVAPHVCKTYDDGYKAGVLFVVDAVAEKHIYTGTFFIGAGNALSNNVTISNSVFIIRPSVTGIQMEGCGTNITINNNQFWSDR